MRSGVVVSSESGKLGHYRVADEKSTMNRLFGPDI